jgi:hypothetical protein
VLLAGQWEIQIGMKGLSMGGGMKSATMCLSPSAFAGGDEKTLLETALRIASSSQANTVDKPQCSFSELEKEPSHSRWKSSCEGHRGVMNGQGTAIVAPESAQLRQSFEISTPFGKRTLEQTIHAKRLGDCA